jgi:Rieske Fe-S protein
MPRYQSDQEEGRADPHADTGAMPGGGMTGGAPANAYRAAYERESCTVAPDGRPASQQPAWRQDFPIDRPQDHYVARRDFTKFLVLVSGAFVFGQVAVGVRNVFRKRRGLPPVVRITALGALPVGGSLVFHYPGEHDDCILVRPAAGTLLAYGQKCTHLSCAVVPKVDEGCLNCPCHEGKFDLATGRPLSGPPRRPLPRVALEVRGGDVYATGVEERTV